MGRITRGTSIEGEGPSSFPKKQMGRIIKFRGFQEGSSSRTMQNVKEMRTFFRSRIYHERKRRLSQPATATERISVEEPYEVEVDNEECDRPGPSGENPKGLKKDFEAQTQSQEGVKADSVILPHPHVLDCSICFQSLTPPVFQCQNGHIACSRCCIKLNRKCSSCSTPIGSNRCRAIERVIESAEVLCPNSEYGCKETIRYLSKCHHLSNECLHEPCSCPISNCSYVGLSRQLYQHFSEKHKPSATQFQFNEVFHVILNVNHESLILQEKRDGVLFILYNCTAQPHWNLISLGCITFATEEGVMHYDLLVKEKSDWRSSIKYQSQTLSFRSKDDLELAACDPEAHKVLLAVPHYLIGSDNELELDICIWGPGYPHENEI